MIRLLPLEQRPNYDAILELYYYTVAMTTPFCPEDIFPTAQFYEHGNTQMLVHPVTSFHQVTGKRNRERTSHYKTLLNRYNIPETSGCTTKKLIENDALLAKRIIEEVFKKMPANQSLYNFLYEGLHPDDFHVRRDRLNCLLTSYMDTRSLKQANLCFVSNANLNELFEVFRYSKFANMPEALQLMDLLGGAVCPYCNRNFTTTISGTNGIRQGQFDHYLSKSKYPWFALSLLNLIPSCGYCNQIKGNKIKPVLYPYKEGMGRHYRFRTRPVHGIGYLTGISMNLDEFEVEGEVGPVPTTPDHAQRIQNSLEIFRLEKLYKTHQEHIAWIFRQRYIFPNTYLEHLCEDYPTLFSSVQEAREMLYLRHLSPERWGEHPLSKLTHDIDEEITELETYYSKGIE